MKKKPYVAPQSAVATPDIDLMLGIGFSKADGSPAMAKRHEVVFEDDETDDEARTTQVRFEYNVWDNGLAEW